MMDFLGIGAQKAGTTWVYAQLSRHPQLRFPGGKEVHFWDRFRKRGEAWYQSRFPEADAGIRQGEITPAYAFMEVEAIQSLHRLYPELRLFYILRNPIERAWSAALMHLRKAELEIDEASDQWFLDGFHSRGSRLRGDYAGAIANWSSVYPREQLLVLDYADIARRPVDFLRACCRHIGADPDFFQADMPELQKKIYAAENKSPLRPSLRPALEALYPQAEQYARLCDGL